MNWLEFEVKRSKVKVTVRDHTWSCKHFVGIFSPVSRMHISTNLIVMITTTSTWHGDIFKVMDSEIKVADRNHSSAEPYWTLTYSLPSKAISSLNCTCCDTITYIRSLLNAKFFKLSDADHTPLCTCAKLHPFPSSSTLWRHTCSSSKTHLAH